jgi:alpha-L-fucosidase
MKNTSSFSRISRFLGLLQVICLVTSGVPDATAQKFQTAELKPIAKPSLQWSGVDAIRYPLDFSGPFKPDMESLKQYQVPEWFRDAKFGIFLHWGIYSVPAYGTADYGRFMYQPYEDVDAGLRDAIYGTIYGHHRKKYGDQDTFGYKDFIPQFTAAKWSPDEWAAFFKECGAKYVVEVAMYHDGFAMYDTSFSKWNAARMGPKRNVAVELGKAVRRQGMKFGVSSHYAWHWLWYTFKPEFDTMNPANVGLYGVPHDHHEWPPQDPSYDADEFWRTIEMIELIKPDVLWFDAGIDRPTYADYRAKIAAHYYNRAQKWGKSVVLNYKGNAYPTKAAVLDLEQSALAQTRDQPWQTDTTTQQNWGYKRDDTFRDTQWCIHQLVDVVSKNGCLLLNIGPRSDGTIPDIVQDTFREIGKWLTVNGEAIYATRPYQMFGEGPDLPGAYRTDAAVSVRYTMSKDHKLLYAIAMDWPKENQSLTLKRVNITRASPNASVKLLGSNEKLIYSIKDGRITIDVPKKQPFQRPAIYAYPFKLSGFDFGAVDASIEADPSGTFVLLPTDVKMFNGVNVATGNTETGRYNIRGWHAGESVDWQIAVTKAGSYRFQVSYTCADARGAELIATCQGSQPLTITVAPTASWSDKSLKTVDIGIIPISQAGKTVISLAKGPDKGGWQPVDVFELRLIPIK